MNNNKLDENALLAGCKGVSFPAPRPGRAGASNMLAAATGVARFGQALTSQLSRTAGLPKDQLHHYRQQGG